MTVFFPWLWRLRGLGSLRLDPRKGEVLHGKALRVQSSHSPEMACSFTRTKGSASAIYRLSRAATPSSFELTSWADEQLLCAQRRVQIYTMAGW